MINLKTIIDSLEVFPNNHCNKKDVRKNNDKNMDMNFFNTLKNEIEKCGKSNTLYVDWVDNGDSIEECEVQKNNIGVEFMNEELDYEDSEEIEEIIDELISILQTIQQLIVKFEADPIKVENINLETFGLDMKEISNFFEQLLSEEDISFVYEDAVKIYKDLDGILSSLMEELEVMENNIVEESKKGTIEQVVRKLDKIIGQLTEFEMGIQSNKIDSKNNQSEVNMEISIDSLNESAEFDGMSDREEQFNTDELAIEKLTREDEGIEVYGNSNAFLSEVIDEVMPREDPYILDKAPLEIDQKQVINQIVDKIKLVTEDNKQEISIKLKPEILGELMLKVEDEKGILLAKIMVDNYRTKEIIEANLHQFKEDIKENGLDIKTFEVFVGNDEDFRRENKQEFSFHRKPRKINSKGQEIEEIKAYDGKVLVNSQDLYDESRLNLFA